MKRNDIEKEKEIVDILNLRLDAFISMVNYAERMGIRCEIEFSADTHEGIDRNHYSIHRCKTRFSKEIEV